MKSRNRLEAEQVTSAEAQSLLLSERRFSDLIAASSDWFWETDEDLRYIYFSDRIFEATGIKPDSLIGKTRQEVAAPQDDIAGWERNLRIMAERKPFKNFIYKSLAADGSVQWRRTSGVPYYDAAGNFGGYRGAASNITTEMEMLDTLRHSEQRFRDIAAASSDRFWETDQNHRFSFIAERPNSVRDIPISFLLGKTRWEASGADPEEDEHWRTHLDILNAHQPFRDFRLHRVDHQGNDRYFSVNGVPIFDDDGEFTGYRGSATDITARVEADRAADKANALLAAAVESLPELFVLWGPDDRLVICNEQFRKVNKDVIEMTRPGTSFAEHIRATIDKGLVPSAVGREEEYFQERMALHGKSEIPIELERQDGIWLLISERNTSSGVATVSLDITKRKKAEEALRFSEDRLRAIVDHVVDGIITFGRDGVVQTLNPAAQRIFNYSVNDVVGSDLSLLMVQPDLTQADGDVRNFFLRNFETVAERQLEIDGVRADGSLVPLEISISEMQTRDGSSFVGIFRDISARREVERLKQEFVSTVSHELRTPLTSIRGSLGLVQGGSAGVIPDAAQDLVDIAYRNTERLMNLVNDILDTEKFESGQMTFDFQTLALDELVQEAVVVNDGYASEYNVRFDVAVADPAITVSADRGRLLQVTANLLSNAAKFSPDGEVVTIRVEREESMARISVSDRGPGIPSEFQPRVFDRFSQASSAKSRQVGGTGLGLYISKSIVERHGGTIDFATEPGTGTTFFFTLPATG